MKRTKAHLFSLTAGISMAIMPFACMAGTVTMATAHAPANCAWTDASIESAYEPARMRASDMGPRRSGASVTHTLVLTGPRGERRLLIDSAGESDETFADIRKRTYLIQYAPDCRALALSFNGKKEYRYVALDSGDLPFYCRHTTFKGSGNDIWANAPATRSLVLEILGSSTKGGASKEKNHADILPESIDTHYYGGIDQMNRLDYNFLGEFRGARSYAAAHPDDAGVRTALARALFLPGHQLDKSEDEDDCASKAGHIARTSSDVRDILMLGIRGGNFSRAAKALANTPDRSVQELLADSLGKAFAAPVNDDSCDRVLDLTWALVSVTNVLHEGTPRLVALLARVAGEKEHCPLIKKDWPNEAVSERGRAARRLAVKGLAAIHKPEAREALRALSRGTCAAHADRDGKDEILNPDARLPEWNPVLKSYFSELIEERDVRLDIACWARAALKYETTQGKK